MNQTTVRAVIDPYDRTMYRLEDLSHSDSELVYDNCILILKKGKGRKHEMGKPVKEDYDTLLVDNTDRVLIPNISSKLANNYTYIFCSLVKKKVDKSIAYQFDKNMYLHIIKGCDDNGYLWCEQIYCTDLYKLIGKSLYTKLIEEEIRYGTTNRI